MKTIALKKIIAATAALTAVFAINSHAAEIQFARHISPGMTNFTIYNSQTHETVLGYDQMHADVSLPAGQTAVYGITYEKHETHFGAAGTVTCTASVDGAECKVSANPGVTIHTYTHKGNEYGFSVFVNDNA